MRLDSVFFLVDLVARLHADEQPGRDWRVQR
jgi:hypothetical protein